MSVGRRGTRAAVFLFAALLGASAQAATVGPLGPTDTLWSTAAKVNAARRLGSQAQVALALFRANPDAFEGSPGRIRPGATLEIPSAQLVQSVSTAQAAAIILQGAPIPASLGSVVSPPAARPAPRDPRSAPPEPRLPAIHAVDVSPADAQGRQTLVITGTEFLPGATLTFRHARFGSVLAGRKPTLVTPERIEYAGRLGARPGTWQVAVVNPDEPPTPTFAFSTAVAPPAPAAVAAVAAVDAAKFAGSAEDIEARAMAQRGATAAQVYEFLLQHEDSYAGDVHYDYALGIAGLEAGKNSDTVLILQRAVATEPGFAGARMELARAYYASGDNESARREFTQLQTEEPPEEAARAIAQYLDLIDQRAAAYERQRSAFLELGMGFDTNANGGPDIQSFVVSGVTVALDSRNQASDSAYYGATLGGLYTEPMAPDLRFIGQGSAGTRRNPDVSFVDSDLLRVGAGLEWTPGAASFAALPSFTRSSLDGEDNSTTVALDASAAYAFAQAQYSVTARHARARYAEGLEIQDVDSTIVGLGTQTVVPGLPVQLAVAVTAGSDEALEAGSPFNRDIVGSRVAAITSFGAGHSLALSAGALEADYEGEFLPGQARRDTQLSAALAYQFLGWRPLGWTLRGQLAFIDNRSTVALFDYDRLDAGFAVRREFK